MLISGDDDVTLPNLPTVNVPIVETPKQEQATVSAPVATETEQDDASKSGFFSRMKVGKQGKPVKTLQMAWMVDSDRW